ncbi:unnamed protein product, partial [Timema podura]|nr:unnamed protein product [Timema podura]
SSSLADIYRRPPQLIKLTQSEMNPRPKEGDLSDLEVNKKIFDPHWWPCGLKRYSRSRLDRVPMTGESRFISQSGVLRVMDSISIITSLEEESSKEALRRRSKQLEQIFTRN